MSDRIQSPDARLERSKQAILDATRELLAEGDVGSLTVEAVAARSGVAKTTIYRRWRDKWELALDAVMIDWLPRFDDPVDVDDTREELITFVDSVVRSLAVPPQGPAMQGLVSRIATEPDLGRAYLDRVIEPRREQLKPVIARGIARGDLRPDTDLRLLHELLLGPVFYRLLLSGPPLDRDLSAGVVDAVLGAFSPRGARSNPKRRARR
ncbi:MAG TPA: TetR/AcrR family transcriptional regulator [Miltoncostaeaceae bacterium]|nr:TetR/AcrR family transcriptional regulator [Miltoncostaeaceae bacterium]